MNKVPVLTGDFPGFVLNRVASAMYSMAVHLLVFGGGSVKRIDRVAQDAGFLSGPFAILDRCTLPTVLKVLEAQESEYPPGAVTAFLRLMRAMVAQGWLGRSADGNSTGFYIWRNGQQKGLNEEVRAVV